MAWTDVVVWVFLAGTPWPALVLLALVAVGAAIWICERTLTRTKPGDDARIRFLGLTRIDLPTPPDQPKPDPGKDSDPHTS